jgi:hypothetical protein
MKGDGRICQRREYPKVFGIMKIGTFGIEAWLKPKTCPEAVLYILGI